jgi:hypothetical protein
MSSDDDGLRRLYRQALSQPASGVQHPDEAAWERVFAEDAAPDDRRRLMEHVVSCPQCADIYRRLTVVRREAAAFDPAVPHRRSASSMRGVAYALAAVLVLAVVGPVTWRAWRASPATSAPAPALRDHPVFRLDKPAVILSAAAALTPRGAPDDRQAFLTALGPALDAYRADDFVQAAERLDAVGKVYSLAVEPPLYAGISQLMLNRPAEAVPRLERARTLASGEFVPEADWRLALAYVHGGDPERARPSLQHVCSIANAYQVRACEALKVLPAVR